MTPPVPPAPRPGLPDPKTIVATLALEPIVPKTAGAAPPPGTPKQKYTILRTNQVDPYETPPASDAEILAAPKTMKAAGDAFAGSDRKVAKLSTSGSKVEKFDDLSALIASLAKEKAMTKHKPPIGTDSMSDRVTEEDRNVRVKAWLYAASRENDNDFHLILGRDPALDKEEYMTMEVSGLPPATAPSFAAINGVRNTFKTFFADHLPGSGYDFPDPPIPVEIGGSLFWDATHAHGPRPGPQDLRPHMPVIWEVHPVTFLKFEP
jgi:hypothetical protein